MASGLPVITTKFCGTSEIIDEGREGYVIDTPNNIEEISNRIADLADSSQREKMGKLGRLRSEMAPYTRNMQTILGIHDACYSPGP